MNQRQGGSEMASTGWLVSFRPPRRYQAADRWLTDTGYFTSSPAKALVVLNPEAAAERLQAPMESRGWPLRAVEQLTMVKARSKRAHRGSENVEIRNQINTRVALHA
jgi:hypothetical protein